MSEGLLGPVVQNEEITKQLRLRGTIYTYNTITASTPNLLKQKAVLEVEDGWRIDKKNKKSIRLAKEKGKDEQLEDTLWCIMARMGFPELSLGRHFTIHVGDEVNPRQIDVFAKDEEVALIIECTQCETPTKKDMSHLIQKITAIRRELFNSIKKHYGEAQKVKPRVVIATKNVIWGQADLTKAKEQQICVLTDSEIDYYEKLTKQLQSVAKYQFLAHLFAGTEIEGLSKTVPATKGSMGGVNFYNFLIKPSDLIKIAYVGHKASRKTDDIETYQRMLKTPRLKAIAEYIDDGGKFPTNIVINFKTDSRKGLRFDNHESIGDSSFGTLHLPKHFASAWVIDGQHRLYGYAYRDLNRSKKGQQIKNDLSTLPVLAFENLPATDEMKMFIDINCEQVKVQKSLLVEIYSDLHWESSDPAERLLALWARIVSDANIDPLSPIYDRIIISGTSKSSDRCLTQTSLSDGLEKSKLLGTIQHKRFVPGPLANSDPDKMRESFLKASTIIKGTLSLFRDAMPGHWDLGDKPGGYLCTNNAIRAIFIVMLDICEHVQHEQGVAFSSLTADEILEEMEKYFSPVIEFFKSASADQISSFRRQQALAGVSKQAMGMNVYINKKFPSFNPSGLRDYIESRDQEGTEIATVLINKVQAKLFKHVVSALKETFGLENDRWWVEGIPYTVREQCTREWEKQGRVKPFETYLYLIQYQSIALDHWDLFGEQFALGHKDKGNRKECVKWIKELNDIRSITHHPEKGVLTTEQVGFVKEIYEKVELCFR